MEGQIEFRNSNLKSNRCHLECAVNVKLINKYEIQDNQKQIHFTLLSCEL